MIIALASPGIASTLDEGLDKIKRFLAEASAQGAATVCFPEAYLPGLRGQDFAVLPFDQTLQERVLQAVAQWARTYAVATILGMERLTAAGRQIVACVIDARGHLQGYQTKNQLAPTEGQFYVPGNTRQLFEINGLKSSLITPSGQCQAYLPYGQEGALVQAINVEEATGLLATRYAPERYQECGLA
jgi:predicted amidohydrolase